MAELQCVVVTPEKTVIDKQIEFVALPLHDGEIGIAAKHSPNDWSSWTWRDAFDRGRTVRVVLR